ncbi:hypothetical protein NDU88_004987 [Pleurodeles waltl]|uniref:Uncharacterized protein n=1 Tax=Pleurodeles waltl TaxID=8319 RepID=A0AAV7SKH2_PLEWA|nr:hypothetical protein NDU88_004987 [Pleurodeles waltl]
MVSRDAGGGWRFQALVQVSGRAPWPPGSLLGLRVPVATTTASAASRDAGPAALSSASAGIWPRPRPTRSLLGLRIPVATTAASTAFRDEGAGGAFMR